LGDLEVLRLLPAAATCLVMKAFFAAAGQPLPLDDSLDPPLRKRRIAWPVEFAFKLTPNLMAVPCAMANLNSLPRFCGHGDDFR